MTGRTASATGFALALAAAVVQAGGVPDREVARLPLVAQAAPTERVRTPGETSAATEWADARAALRAGAGKGTLAGSLAALLGVRSSADIEVLERFERSNQRLPWKSALAFGVGDGYVFYGWAAGERATITAAGNAEGDCRRLSRAPCAVVLSDGKFDEHAFANFAGWLGIHPQALVRGDLLNKIRTNPYQGGVGSIERQP